MTPPYLPMLGKDAAKVDGQVRLPVGPEWRIEKKLDGWRWIVHITTERGRKVVRSWSGRNGQERTGATLSIDLELSFLPDDTVLDGELILTESDGRTGMGGSPAVSRALAHGEPLTFVVFDVLRLAGTDLTANQWQTRRAYLDTMAKGFDGLHVRASEVAVASTALHEEWLADGFEGSMAKRINAPYRPGKRSDNFTKVKPQETAEAIVVGFIAGKGGIVGQVGAFEIRLIDTGVVTSVAVPPKLREEVTAHGADLWLGKMIEFAHHGIRDDSGKPRHPVKPRLLHRRDDR